MEEHPALRRTPESFAAQVREGSESARRLAQRELSDTLQQLRMAADDMKGIVEGHRTRRVQNYWLAGMAGAGAVFGVIAWVGFSGPIARALPASWQVPERMAAATLRLDRGAAGARLIQGENAATWREMMTAIELVKSNSNAISACKAVMVRTKRPIRCLVTLQP
jgi:hypothetical protein